MSRKSVIQALHWVVMSPKPHQIRDLGSVTQDTWDRGTCLLRVRSIGRSLRTYFQKKSMILIMLFTKLGYSSNGMHVEPKRRPSST